MTGANSNGKTATKLVAALLGAVVALQSVFVALLVSHIQNRSIHSDQQSVSLAAYRADREHFQGSLDEIKLSLRDIQRRLEKTQTTGQMSFPAPKERESSCSDGLLPLPSQGRAWAGVTKSKSHN